MKLSANYVAFFAVLVVLLATALAKPAVESKYSDLDFKEEKIAADLDNETAVNEGEDEETEEAEVTEEEVIEELSAIIHMLDQEFPGELGKKWWKKLGKKCIKVCVGSKICVSRKCN